MVIDLGGTHLRLGHLSADAPAKAERTLQTEGLRRIEPVAFLAESVNAYARAHDLKVGAVVVSAPFTPNAERSGLEPQHSEPRGGSAHA